MANRRMSIATFLERARQMIRGIKTDDFIKERFRAYNIDENRIEEISALYDEAAGAESDKWKEYGEQLEASTRADEEVNAAMDQFYKYKDFLKVVLEKDREKLSKIFIKGLRKSNSESHRLKEMYETYDRVLEDEEIVAEMARFNMGRETLEQGKLQIIDAMECRRRHTEEKGEAQHATHQREKIFEKLESALKELKTIGKHAFKDRPQVLEILGIQVPSNVEPEHVPQAPENSKPEETTSDQSL